MCGGAEFQEAGIYDTSIAVSDVLIAGLIGGVTVGAVVTLVASAIVLQGPRRWVSVAMLAMMAMIIMMIFRALVFNMPLLNPLIIQGLITTIVVLFAFAGLVSLIYWPTNKRIVNLPLAFGAGVSTLCTLALVIFI